MLRLMNTRPSIALARTKRSALCVSPISTLFDARPSHHVSHAETLNEAACNGAIVAPAARGAMDVFTQYDLGKRRLRLDVVQGARGAAQQTTKMRRILAQIPAVSGPLN